MRPLPVNLFTGAAKDERVAARLCFRGDSVQDLFFGHSLQQGITSKTA